MLIFTLGTMRNPRATAFGGRSAFRRRTHASPTSSETKTPPKYHLKTHEENRKTFALRTGGSRAGLLLYRQGGKPGYVSREALASGFVTPPDSIQTSVYWYWISNNISKEGVVKDLESMKKAGINRAFIGNIGQDDRTLRQRQDAQRRMVGRSPHRTEKSDRTGHRDRHIQLPRLEPVGRPRG